MESFKPVIFEDGTVSVKYTVSNFGRVFNTATNKFVSQSITGPEGSNYFCVNLNEPNKKRVSRKVHVLVARSWLRLDDCTGLEVDHIDINRFNNNLYNLRWVTRTENMNNRSPRKHNCTSLPQPICKKAVTNSANINNMLDNICCEKTHRNTIQFINRYIDSVTLDELEGMVARYIKYGVKWNSFVQDFNGDNINIVDWLQKYNLQSNTHIFKDDLLKTLAVGTFGYGYCFGKYGYESNGIWRPS